MSSSRTRARLWRVDHGVGSPPRWTDAEVAYYARKIAEERVQEELLILAHRAKDDEDKVSNPSALTPRATGYLFGRVGELEREIAARPVVEPKKRRR